MNICFPLDDSQAGSGATSTVNDSTSSGQQDWSAVWECFESPHRLLSMPAGGLSKSMQVISIVNLSWNVMVQYKAVLGRRVWP